VDLCFVCAAVNKDCPIQHCLGACSVEPASLWTFRELRLRNFSWTKQQQILTVSFTNSKLCHTCSPP